MTDDERKEMLRKSQSNYRKKLRTYIVRCRIEQDADLIERLSSVDNISAYLRGLIRADIESSKA